MEFIVITTIYRQLVIQVFSVQEETNILFFDGTEFILFEILSYLYSILFLFLFLFLFLLLILRLLLLLLFLPHFTMIFLYLHSFYFVLYL